MKINIFSDIRTAVNFRIFYDLFFYSDGISIKTNPGKYIKTMPASIINRTLQNGYANMNDMAMHPV